jgi:hypothetical protein
MELVDVAEKAAQFTYSRPMCKPFSHRCSALRTGSVL